MATKQHTLLYASSYDRGLQYLLFMFPDIKKSYPDAELYIAYGWDLFDIVAHNNKERMEWKKHMQTMMNQEGIHHMGRLGKEELYNLREKCGIWAYPTDFEEINCITALEAQSQGCVPVTISLAALSQSVGSGVKVQGDIRDLNVQKEYLKELLAIMGDTKKWEEESKKARKFARDYKWDNVYKLWINEFNKKEEDVKVTVYTPTIRRGFWNIMAHNLQTQTYKNFEWVIVDDYKEDRSDIAKDYAKKYNLDIRYLRGKERVKKRTYGLINANNTVMSQAKGELLVFLQDFMLISPDSIEELVSLYKKNPKSLIATCDINVQPKIKPDIESEDWFHGETDVVGQLVWKNVRIQNKGLRNSTNPFDFEQNWGAIPMSIVRELNGWWEFQDEGLGYDNTDIAYRALKMGYSILIDETNIAIGINHWEALEGSSENVLGRARRLNDPRYQYIVHMTDTGKLPVVRKESIDDNTDLLYEIPESVKDEEIVEYIRNNSFNILKTWL